MGLLLWGCSPACWKKAGKEPSKQPAETPTGTMALISENGKGCKFATFLRTPLFHVQNRKQVILRKFGAQFATNLRNAPLANAPSEFLRNRPRNGPETDPKQTRNGAKRTRNGPKRSRNGPKSSPLEWDGQGGLSGWGGWGL